MNKEKKPDLRIKRTKLSLRTALIQLLMKKRLNEITVKELCEQAGINRGTFYLHYSDVFDLLAKIEEEMYDEIMEFIAKNAQTGKMGDPNNMLPTFIDLFEYLVHNADVCTILLLQDFNQDFVQRLLNVGLDECVENWMKMFQITKRHVVEMFYHYIVSGCVGILRYWLQTGRKETSDELANLTKLYITKGIGMLENYRN